MHNFRIKSEMYKWSIQQKQHQKCQNQIKNKNYGNWDSFSLELFSIKKNHFWCLTPLSAIFQLYQSWRPVLVVEEAGVPGENHRPWASNW